MNYAIILAVLFAMTGAALIVLGLGDHLDILVRTSGNLEARFVNASPGIVLWRISALLFWLSKPKRLRASVHHGGSEQED